MPEYGRAIQDMVLYAIGIENREERQRCAQSIVDIMGGMQPAMQEQADFENKLWNHLAYISQYKLDVDYPYPINRIEEGAQKPEPLKYPKKNIRHRHYGYLMEQFLQHLATMPEGEERNQLLADMANQMRQSLYDWNRDAMESEKIASDIQRYTDGRVSLDLSTFQFDPVVQGSLQGGGKKKKKKK